MTPSRILLLLSLCSACASLSTFTERPEAYHLYRASRVAPTLEERLTAAYRYLREVPGGAHTAQVRRFFQREEEKYYLAAFDRLPNLRAYEAALPHGPHIEEVRSRIAVLEARLGARSRRAAEEEARALAALANLERADADRRAFVTLVKDWTAHLLALRSFGKPTSELPEQMQSAFAQTDPRATCERDHCSKLLRVSYAVPGQGAVAEREATFEVRLQLERGVLSRARLAGPELWTRLAEALAVKPLTTSTPEERAEALNRVALLMRALLEPRFPAAECDAPATPPAIVVRTCQGVRVAVLAAAAAGQDDALEVAPVSR